MASSEEEWEEVVAALSSVKTPNVRKLFRALEVSLFLRTGLSYLTHLYIMCRSCCLMSSGCLEKKRKN